MIIAMAHMAFCAVAAWAKALFPYSLSSAKVMKICLKNLEIHIKRYFGDLLQKKHLNFEKQNMLAKSTSVVVSTLMSKQTQLASKEDGGILESFNGCV